MKKPESFLAKTKADRRSFLAGASAVGALSATGLGVRPARAAGKLVFYNWSTYIDEETIPEFSDQFGVEVSEDFFADNDELFNKLRTATLATMLLSRPTTMCTE